MKTPEKDNLTIYLLDIGESDQLVWCNDPDPGAGMSKDDAIGPHYHASLLKDDKWLADNGLKRFCKTCHGERKIPIFDKKAGGTYLSHYEPCMDCQQINVSGF